jgi:hypothetical protein
MNKLNEEQKKEIIEKKKQAVHDADGRVGLPMHKFLGLIGFQLLASRSSLFTASEHTVFRVNRISPACISFLTLHRL